MKPLVFALLILLALTVPRALAATITSPATATATVGQPFTYQITVSQTPTPGYSFVNLAPGLAGNSVTGVITGTPTAAGSYSMTIGANVGGIYVPGTLVLTVNAAGGGGAVTPPPSPATSLFCATDPNPACGAVLNWNAPPAATNPALSVTGYLVFRSIGGGSATQLTATPITATTFTDSTIAPSTTYDYYVAAVDAAGTQSAPSNTLTIVVAAAPSIPTPATPLNLTGSVIN